jgi:hypothetical protein
MSVGAAWKVNPTETQRGKFCNLEAKPAFLHFQRPGCSSVAVTCMAPTVHYRTRSQHLGGRAFHYTVAGRLGKEPDQASRVATAS